MSGISGYVSPVKKRLEAHNQQANGTSQQTHPANTDIDENPNKKSADINTEVKPPIVVETLSDQSQISDKKSSPYKVIENVSETSYISALSGTRSQSYEALYSSEDDSLPKVIDEHDEKRKSCIVIQDSAVVQNEDRKGDYATKSINPKKLLHVADNEMKDVLPKLKTEKQSSPDLNINELKEDTKKNEDSKLKEAQQIPSAKFKIEQTAQYSHVSDDDKKANPPTTSTAKSNETKKTESFTTQYLLSAEKSDEAKVKKLAQIQKTDNLDHRSKNTNDVMHDLKTNVKTNVNDASNRLAFRDSSTNLQQGENCLDILPTDKSNERKPIRISPGRLDILNDLHTTGEGTAHYDVGDILLEKPNVPISITYTRNMLSTESQIENLRKIRHILEDKLKCANSPEEEDEDCYQDAVSDPQPNEVIADKAGKSTSNESEHTKLLELLTEKTSKTDKLKSVKSSVTIVEIVKFVPDALLHGLPSTAFKLSDTQPANSQSLKQLISNEPPIATCSEDTSEIIQVILPEEHKKAALVGDLGKAEPKDSCKPCPGIKPSRTSCLDPPEEPVKEEEAEPPPPPPEKKPPPFECFEPEDTPEYEGSDTDPSETPPSGMRMLWWKIKQRILSVVIGVYNCFHCERICPIFSPGRLQSPNTSAAYEATQPVKMPNNSIVINSNSGLIHSKDSVHVHTKFKRVTPNELEQRMIKPEGSEPEKSRSTVMPEKTKSTRFDLENVKTADSDEVRQMPVQSTVPRKF